MLVRKGLSIGNFFSGKFIEKDRGRARTAMRVLRILGIRGLPASHGGFETFAEYLAIYLLARGWRVTVYCQQDGSGPVFEDTWQDIHRVHIPVSQKGPKGTIVFDWKATVDAAQHGELCLTLGYNTAVFCGVLRANGVPNLINMDGIEWARAKWGRGAKTWFWLNDWAGCWLGNHLIADHPEIKRHLASRVSEEKIALIPYGAERIQSADVSPVVALELEPGRFLTLIARPEPENSILEAVSAFSRRLRGQVLAVLGNYDESNAYHRAVKAAAGTEVRFLGAIYDKAVLRSLRFHSTAYVHGHQVGGTNPSLVEALGAGNAVIAHDNRFNRWVAGDGGAYFKDVDECAALFDTLLAAPQQLAAMQAASRMRHQERFTWERVLAEYEALLLRFHPEAAKR
jgi:glycosyltransferase involved in cell wall biosynthesis